MGFFEYYFNIHGGTSEQPVCCPFPHVTTGGIKYYETHPSASCNLDKRLFHCVACDTGYNEVSFVQQILQCTFANATRLLKAFDNTEDITQWEMHTSLDTLGIKQAKEFGISEDVLKELRVVNNNMDGTLIYPVFMYGKLIDVRTYVPANKPKVKSRVGAASGLVIPLDEWQTSPCERTTIVCAGEKDMSVARTHGFNAITITGGENTLPLSPMWFKDRDIVICYDNDEAGLHGAIKLASFLLEYCRTVKVCTSFHNVCVETKEDLTDFFNKYGRTREDLIAYMNDTPYFTKEDCVQQGTVSTYTLKEVLNRNLINKTVRSNIQVAAISEVQYILPTILLGEKIKTTEDKGQHMLQGEVKEWNLTDETLKDILHLIDNGFKETDITANAKNLMHILPTEKYIKVSKPNTVVVYKAYVTEMFESMNTDTMPLEYVAYSIGTRLESGKKYMVNYKLVPHPYRGQQLVMLITSALDANDSISNFKVCPETVEHLKVVQEIQGSVHDKVHALVQKVKGLLGYDGNDLLIQTLDLAYHTVLSFNFGTFQNVRGYLDTLIVGESRVGKSSTADTLRTTYQLGTFTSLAGNSATIPGLIGGSNKTTGGSYQTKAGLIPQNHKGMIIFEEFGKCHTNIIQELTDIRSSNEVRITRISGTLALPAIVRMVSLSNIKATQGEIKSIASYPNGVAIATELIGTAEDIARYDILAILGDKGNCIIDPYWQPETPLPTEVYQTRVRWVWSRTTEQVSIAPEVGRYICEQANALNTEYDCHIKIFGTEAWKKLSRLAIAVAGYVVSTDSTYTNIVVLKEHVDFAVQYYKNIYDNPTFKLREYVIHERKYNTIDDEGVHLLQNIYHKCPALLLMLEQEAKISRMGLMAAAGLDNNQYNIFMNQLIAGSFVRLSSNDILPTERFRQGMSRIARTDIRRLGENA